MNQKSLKSAEEYRRDIFTLKSQLKSQEEYLQQLKQEYSDVDVFSDETYTFSMKVKILQYNLNDIKEKIHKYSTHEAAEYYALNFGFYAMGRACEIIGVNREMVFRGVDVESKGSVNWHDFVTFLKEVLRMDNTLINPIMAVLDPNSETVVTKQRYHQLIYSFMLESQKPTTDHSQVNEAVVRVAKQIVSFKVSLEQIWKEDVLNIATTIYGLKKKLKELDVLDGVALYCKCDPMKEGVIEKKVIVKVLEHQIHDLKNWKQGQGITLQKK